MYGTLAGRPSTASCHARSSVSTDAHSATPVCTSMCCSSALTPAYRGGRARTGLTFTEAPRVR